MGLGGAHFWGWHPAGSPSRRRLARQLQVGCPVLAVLQDEAVLGERGTERGWGLLGGWEGG